MKLGRLQKIDLRQQWNKEDTEITPWLAKDENIELLGETIGIELLGQGQEENVGPLHYLQYQKPTFCESYLATILSFL